MNFSLGVVLSEVLFIKKTDARCVKIINYFMLFAAAAVMYLKGPEHLPGDMQQRHFLMAYSGCMVIFSPSSGMMCWWQYGHGIMYILSPKLLKVIMDTEMQKIL